MKASFFEYNIAMSGLFNAKANLNVVSHNIANAAIPGYTRQQTLQKAARPLALRDGKGMYGTGSEVYGITQIRDIYLDRKYWQQKNVLGEYTAKNTNLSFMETVFNNMPDAGLHRIFNDFFNRLHDLSGNTPDATYRTNIITAAETLTEMIRSNAQTLLKHQQDINQEVLDIVTVINSLGTQLADINKQIFQFEIDGSHANDLRDHRALMIDELSQYVNVSVEERDFSKPGIPYDKRTTIMINGYDFVNHDFRNSLVCVPRMNEPIPTSPPPSPVNPLDDKYFYTDPQTGSKILYGPQRNVMDAPGLYDIAFSTTGSKFDIFSPTLKGTLKGLIDVRDGNNGMLTEPTADINGNPLAPSYKTTDYKGIPFYMNKLNQLVRTVARAFNEGLDSTLQPIPGYNGISMGGHKSGFDVNGKNNELYFFTYEGGEETADLLSTIFSGGVLDYDNINALNFIINPKIVENQELLAYSDNGLSGQSNNNIILNFQRIGTYPSLFKEGKIVDYIIATSDHLAIDRMQAKKFEASYTEIILQTDNQRLAVSGVDLNEEIMDMVKYNQLYQACARLVNVINQIYDTMINRLGVS